MTNDLEMFVKPFGIRTHDGTCYFGALPGKLGNEK